MCAAPSPRTAFVLVERLGEETLEIYSCGDGRFIPGTPSADIEICFRVYKTESSLSIHIHENSLLQWLRAVLLPYDDLDHVLSDASISMDTLLPYYPQMSAAFNQNQTEGHSFDALDLFVRHFLREGSIFACFGFERLHEEQILTELQFHHIHSRSRSISEDLDLLDEAIGELDEEDIQGPIYPFPFINEPSLSQLQTAIKQHNNILVHNALAMDPGSVDAKTLCLAICHYERDVFQLLLGRGAQVDGDGCVAGPLYHAAKAGHMEAVQLLLIHGANKEGGNSCISAAPMSGAASGGHLEIVQYLFEQENANVNGNGYKSPLSRAIKHRHAYIIDYLLRAGAKVLEEDYIRLLSQFLENSNVPYRDILGSFIAGMNNNARDLLFSRAVSEVIEADSNIDPNEIKELNGQLEIFSSLLEAGANDYQARRAFKPTGEFVESNLPYEESSKLISDCEADNMWLKDDFIASTQTDYTQTARELTLDFIGSKGPKDSESFEDSESSTDFQSFNRSATIHARQVDISKVWINYQRMARQPTLDFMPSKGSDVENCPAVAAIQVQSRRNMTRRLIAKVSNSCEKLLDASTKGDASTNLIEFVDHIGTSISVWRSGTRAIRDICEGYMPRCLSSIVSALQVADAMRSAVPSSQLGCSKEEFVDDIPRWATLLSPDDQSLLFEIAYYIWGVPVSTIGQEGADNFSRPLELLQLLVNRLVRACGLFDHGSANSLGSYRLQTLRQQYFSTIRCGHTCERRLPLTKWCPSPTQGALGNLHINSSKPPDPEMEQSSILARITVFMAGAIFGAILLYLCLSRYGFSILRLPMRIPDDGQDLALDQIITRNSVILTMYLESTSDIDFGSCKSINHLLPDSLSTENFQDNTTAVQSSYDINHIILGFPSTVDTIMEPTPANSSLSVSSNLSTSSSAITISPSPITTPRSVPTSTSASMDGTICCEYCSSKFKLGRNGHRGQASNLQKHIKNYHPETLQNYYREIYKCRYGCGAVDPNKWNIKVHEEKHCANKKGKQPRRHGKWRRFTTGTS